MAQEVIIFSIVWLSIIIFGIYKKLSPVISIGGGFLAACAALIVFSPSHHTISVPSDPNAQYFVLEKGGSGALRTIVTKRVGPSGTGYSKRLYNCTDNMVKYLGTGDSLTAMDASLDDPEMAPIVRGSIAYYIGIEACK